MRKQLGNTTDAKKNLNPADFFSDTEKAVVSPDS